MKKEKKLKFNELKSMNSGSFNDVEKMIFIHIIKTGIKKINENGPDIKDRGESIEFFIDMPLFCAEININRKSTQAFFNNMNGLAIIYNEFINGEVQGKERRLNLFIESGCLLEDRINDVSLNKTLLETAKSMDFDGFDNFDDLIGRTFESFQLTWT